MKIAMDLSSKRYSLEGQIFFLKSIFAAWKCGDFGHSGRRGNGVHDGLLQVYELSGGMITPRCEVMRW